MDARNFYMRGCSCAVRKSSAVAAAAADDDIAHRRALSPNYPAAELPEKKDKKKTKKRCELELAAKTVLKPGIAG